MRASIVIPAHNEGELLARTVQSCLQTTQDLSCEIVVADDASDDGSVDVVRRRFPDVRIVEQAQRLGCSPAKVLGASAAQGDVLIFLDGHCKPEPRAIERLINCIEDLDEEAVVMPRIAALDSETWENSETNVARSCRFNMNQFDFFWEESVDLERAGRFYLSPGLVGCCVAVSRALYEKVWGFDKDMYQWGSEDIDFGLKVWFLGHDILVHNHATIGHRFASAFGYEIRPVHPLVNKLRTARKNFTDATWTEWLERFRVQSADDQWDEAWVLFEQARASAEREREFLMRSRIRDEFDYAERFGLDWPRRACGSSRAGLHQSHYEIPRGFDSSSPRRGPRKRPAIRWKTASCGVAKEEAREPSSSDSVRLWHASRDDSDQASMRIPPVFHQSWKDERIPVDVYPSAWRDSWQRLHPEWETRFWTDEANERLVREHYPEFHGAYRAFDQDIKRADFARFLYMHRYGGVYVDLDFVCLRNIEPTLRGFDIVLGGLSEDNHRYQVPNAFMASRPGLDFWIRTARDAANAPPEEHGVEEHTGPLRLESALDRYRPSDSVIYGDGIIYPLDWIYLLPNDLGGCYREDVSQLSAYLRERSVPEMAAVLPHAYCVTFWAHKW